MVLNNSRRQKLYFAHAMCTYGKSDERRDLARIRRRWTRAIIVNPARYSEHPEKLADTMNFCFGLVGRCQFGVFTRLLGKITCGVGKEVNHALKIGKPVFELDGKKLVHRSRRVSYISRVSTIRLYAKYRQSRFL